MANKNQGEQNKALDSVFSGILKEFGTNVPQLSVVVAVIIGSLGFETYFNAGAWTIISILCFALVYLFRRQIIPDIKKVGIFVFFLFLLLLTPTLIFIFFKGTQEFLAFLKRGVLLTTAYSAVIITIPLAILISSYRKQESVFGLKYPDGINRTIENQITKSRFFKSRVVYDINFIKIENNHLIIETALSYKVTNRTDEKQIWNSVLRSGDPNPEIIYFKFDKEPIYIDDPQYKIPHGYKVSRELGPHQTVSVAFKDTSKYNLYDSELYTTYDPTEDLTIKISNKYKFIKLSFEMLVDRYGKPIHSIVEDTKYTLKIEDGVLPYEGVRLCWKKEGGNYENENK